MSVSETGRASRTAMMVAALRAQAGQLDPPWCHDPWAAELAGEDGFEHAAAFEQLVPHARQWMGVRTAYIDAWVRKLTNPLYNVRQVVLLGAGLDTRAARLARAGVRFYEVDAPASAAEKQRRLAGLDGYPIGAATYVDCDFERQSFVDELQRAGFDPAQEAFLIWEGVTPYLTEEAVRATLRRIAEGLHPRSVVVFDYLGKRLVQARNLPAHNEESVKLIRRMGEPLQFGINDVLPLLFEEGFRWVRSTSFDEACLMLSGTYERAREFRFQHLAVASRTPLEVP